MTERVIFRANTSTYGTELYIMSADGQSVSLLEDINPGAGNGNRFVYVGSLAATWPGDRLVFSANDGQDGNWFWITDGTTAGTYSLGDILPDSTYQDITGSILATSSGYAYAGYYTADDDWANLDATIWRTDGTVSGTQEIADFDMPVRRMVPVVHFDNTVLWVSTEDAKMDGTRSRLWAYDETTGALTALGTAFAIDPVSFIGLGDVGAIFTLVDPVEGGQLWVTDGTVAGTQMLLDPNPGIRNVAPIFINTLNGLAFFTLMTSQGYSSDLWVSDGTVAGTHKFTDFDPTGVDTVDRLVVSDDALFFRATDGTAARLYISDGTAAGTTALRASDGTLLDITYLGQLVPLGDTGRVVFTIDPELNRPGMEELWVSDGTAAGTFKLMDVDVSERYNDPMVAGDKVYFRVGNVVEDQQLWVSDGTVAGTHHLPGVDPELLESYYFYVMGTVDVNEAPEGLALSGGTVTENVAAGTVIGTFSATDPENNGALSYQLLNAGGGNLAIRGNQLIATGPLDYETASQLQITVRVSDVRGGTQDRSFTITLRDANDAPTAIALSGTQVTENVARGTVVGTLSASDQDGDALSYSLIDTAGGRFALRGTQIVTAGPINYEEATRHVITVQISDGQGGVTLRDFTISIGDVNDPTIRADRLTGTAGADTIRALAGDDVVEGARGNDLLHGGLGHDRLRGQGGEDRLIGTAGNDTLLGGGGADRLIGGRGLDVLGGGAGDDRLLGGAGRDVLRGQGGADRLEGGTASDRLVGGRGADTLVGGEGNDTMSGGLAADRFVFAGRFGRDVIEDFGTGADVIDLSGRGLTFRTLETRAVHGGADTLIVIGQNRILLEGVQEEDLRAGMFVF